MSSEKKKFTVLVDERVEKDLKTVPKHITLRFLDLLDELEEDPFQNRSGLDVKLLKGHDDLYRIRLGDYRVLFSLDKPNRTVIVTTVVHRRRAYRSLII
ncbi:MAG: type II toxin-antitoxin system RelE family toxin [Thermoplasmatota archaeon]